MKKQPKKLSKKVNKSFEEHNELFKDELFKQALAHSITLFKNKTEKAIDKKIEGLKLEEKNAVGSKLTATLKGMNLLHELKEEIL